MRFTADRHLVRNKFLMRALSANVIELQGRDLTLIRALTEQFRLLTREQIADLLGVKNPRTLNARLKKLRDAGYLSMRTLFRFGAARQLVYYLGPLGVGLHDHPADKRLAETARVKASQLRGSDLSHRLLVDSIHIRFLTASRTYSEYRLVAWIDQYSPSWEEFQEYGIPVRADGYAEYLLLLHFDSLSTFFLEVDCGTESCSILEDKIQRYTQYAKSELHELQFAAKTFRVLFVMSSEQRVANVLSLMKDAPPDLFWVTTAERFKRSKLFDAYWRRPNTEGSYSLRFHV